MELLLNDKKETYDYINYVKPLRKNYELCNICLMDETKEYKPWDRYKLKCGHVFHSRCFRRYCHVKEHLCCSLCGPLPETQENLYCSVCDVFWH
jgi:hypothetical protein